MRCRQPRRAGGAPASRVRRASPPAEVLLRSRATSAQERPRPPRGSCGSAGAASGTGRARRRAHRRRRAARCVRTSSSRDGRPWAPAGRRPAARPDPQPAAAAARGSCFAPQVSQKSAIPADDRAARAADSHSLFHRRFPQPWTGGVMPSCQAAPAGPISFFQIGTRSFSASMISSAQRNAGRAVRRPDRDDEARLPDRQPARCDGRPRRRATPCLRATAPRDRRAARVRPSADRPGTRRS